MGRPSGHLRQVARVIDRIAHSGVLEARRSNEVVQIVVRKEQRLVRML